MPTYTAITLDRLMEPGVTIPKPPMKNGNNPKHDRWRSTNSMVDRRINHPGSRLERGVSVPNSNPGSRLERGVSVPNSKSNGKNGTLTGTGDRKHQWTTISPALYATPESTPVPDSPSSFPPSPYIVNHKRRGPRLIKTFSEVDVAVHDKRQDENKLDKETKPAEQNESSSNNTGTSALVMVVESSRDDTTVPPAPPVKQELVNGATDAELGIHDLAKGSSAHNFAMKSVKFSLQGDEADDFFDPHESMSVKSNAESDSNSLLERSAYIATPTAAEFFDAWEDLSSECAPQPSVPDFEGELQEIRMSLLMEMEKRRQAEETLSSMQVRWQQLRDQFLTMGLTLPCNLAELHDNPQNDPADELSRQLYLARFVSNSIGRGTAKAEIEMEMEAHIDLKDFEIARLTDKLHYYEAVTREMSQRNQETIEAARRLRQRKKKAQRWVWGSIAGAITLGAGVLAWSYIPSGNKLTSPSQSHSPDSENASNQ